HLVVARLRHLELLDLEYGGRRPVGGVDDGPHGTYSVSIRRMLVCGPHSVKRRCDGWPSQRTRAHAAPRSTGSSSSGPRSSWLTRRGSTPSACAGSHGRSASKPCRSTTTSGTRTRSWRGSSTR